MARLSRRALLGASVALAALRAVRSGAADAPVARVVRQRLVRRGTRFEIGLDAGAVTSLRVTNDAAPTDYVRAGRALGPVRIRWRTDQGHWQPFDSARAVPSHVTVGAVDCHSGYRVGGGIELEIRLALDQAMLIWEITLHNTGVSPVEIGDLHLPLPINTIGDAAKGDLDAVLKHAFISGHGSHLFWMRRTSIGPYLLLLPGPTTHLEYWDLSAAEAHGDGYGVYIHAAASAGEAAARGTRWRLPVTSLTLAPGARRRYELRFSLVEDYDAARDAIVAAGLIDVDVVPGMTVPSDLCATIALRSAAAIHGVDAEYPRQTHIEALGARDGRHFYRIRFTRLGENRLTILHGDGATTYLEFFATEPIETMIAKRGAFIAAHQHRDPAKWYNGLFGEWNMASQTLLGPDNYDRIKGWRIYEVTCDDPGLSKPAFLAAKNAEYPVQAEVTALDDYIQHFVWGGLQRTQSEAYAYGIYGIPDWRQNRDSADPGTKGRLHLWRPYDYPHVVLLYFAMYRVARHRSGVTTRLAAATYLSRAFGTARAMFTVPMALAHWSANETGFYNEVIFPDLIAALEHEGQAAQAAELRGYWEDKVRFFITGTPDLFGSEYAFDSTGFETTQALAGYARDHAVAGVSDAARDAFDRRQITANLFCRGWLEPTYYLLGSDYRAGGGNSYTLSYMAQMGGWAVLDHALRDPTDPHALLRLGYASFLSSWALLNSGTPESDYGYWYPGQANDGGAAGGFEPAPSGLTWLDQPHHRGAWYYACEIDLGFCGALRAAATILADDPVFGRICHGGDWRAEGDRIAITPRDGVRRRFNARLDGHRLDMSLAAGRFASITLASDLSRIDFAVEGAVAGAHVVLLTIGDGQWRIDGTEMDAAAGPIAMRLPGLGPTRVTVIRVDHPTSRPPHGLVGDRTHRERGE